MYAYSKHDRNQIKLIKTLSIFNDTIVKKISLLTTRLKIKLNIFDDI